jgi:hypothetical protein
MLLLKSGYLVEGRSSVRKPWSRIVISEAEWRKEVSERRRGI